MGPHGGGGVSMSPGGPSMMSRGGGIVPGAAPMGAGLVPSTGAAGAVKAGGLPHARGGGLPFGVLPPPGEAYTIGKAYTCQYPEKSLKNRQK